MSGVLSGAALVTGGAHRVGEAIARHLAALGMRVVISYNSSHEAAQRVTTSIREAGGECSAIQADLSESGAGAELVSQAEGLVGDLSLLVPCAANFEAVSFEDISEGHLTRAMRLNTFASVELAQSAYAGLRRAEGSIVLITGYGVRRPYKRYLPYLLSKYAADGLSRALALELAPDVRVNAVAPGTVIPPVDYDEDDIARLTKAIPLGRVGSGESVAEAVAYLAGAKYVTGQTVFVDGGRGIA